MEKENKMTDPNYPTTEETLASIADGNPPPDDIGWER